MEINIATKEDLEALKSSLLREIKTILEANSIPSNRFLRTKDVLKLLKISQGSLLNYRAKGLLNPQKIEGTVFYDYKEIEKLLRKKNLDEQL